MIYPLNIMTPDPVSGGIRPSMIFVVQEVQFDVMKSLSYGVTKDLLLPVGGFILPMPNGSLIDSSQNTYSQESSVAGEINQKAMGLADGAMTAGSLGMVNNGMAKMGRLPDPRLTQVYMGTGPRNFSMEWNFVPQSFVEATSALLILGYIKYIAAPDRMKNSKIGVLKQPYVLKAIFTNPILHKMMDMDQLAITSYSINYFAQGYSSTYESMIPKEMTLSLELQEFSIKTKEDWASFKI